MALFLISFCSLKFPLQLSIGLAVCLCYNSFGFRVILSLSSSVTFRLFLFRYRSIFCPSIRPTTFLTALHLFSVCKTFSYFLRLIPWWFLHSSILLICMDTFNNFSLVYHSNLPSWMLAALFISGQQVLVSFVCWCSGPFVRLHCKAAWPRGVTVQSNACNISPVICNYLFY